MEEMKGKNSQLWIDPKERLTPGKYLLWMTHEINKKDYELKLEGQRVI